MERLVKKVERRNWRKGWESNDVRERERQDSIVHWAYMDKTESGNRIGVTGKIPI